ncbi:MAG: hypothetical protein A2X56_00275 [Nitrospirae bacterium GWC2_57_13]|nr:MAG: hypothetical protein A2X56_00275 [Nitrospirae bacterium GWC2_57_13]
MSMKAKMRGSIASAFCLLLLLLQLFVAVPPAAAVDSPHNTISINCQTCHISVPPATWWSDQGQSGGLCGQCHNSGLPMGDVQTHSSTKYGDITLQCTTCHDPHYQMQNRAYATSGDVYYYDPTATGIVLTANANSITKSGGTAWPVDIWKDMLLIPNTKYQKFNYRIISNTADTITVDTSAGSINLTYAKPTVTFAIVYGKLVKDYIQNKQVKFFRNHDEKSFADGVPVGSDGRDLVVDGVCQVCHTKTTSFTNTGVLESATHPAAQAGENCKSCHTHTGGFQGGCNLCHGFPPVENTAGTNGLAFNPGTTGSAFAGAHDAHITNAKLVCADCHFNSAGSGATHNNGDLFITMGFYNFSGAVQGGQYDGQTTANYNATTTTPPTTWVKSNNMTCSTVYCHSTVQSASGGALTAGDYKTPSWTNAAPNNVICGSCHGDNTETADALHTGAIMSSASHTKHVASSGYSMPCLNCHTNAGAGTTDHVNNLINIAFNTTYGGSYTGSTTSPNNHAPGLGYGTCSTNYCHSQGTATVAPYPAPNQAPTWGNTTTGECGDCHGADGTTPPSSSSHAKHVGSSGVYQYNCNKCHELTVDNTAATSAAKPAIANKALHVNKTKDVDLDTTDALVGALATDNNAGACSTVYCHSTGKAADVPTAQLPAVYSGSHYTTVTWGDTLTCASCHGKTQTTGTYTGYPDYTMADQATDKGTARANSHLSITHNNTGCAVCHNNTTIDGTTIASSTHVNAAINVNFDSSHGGATATYNAGGTPRTCSNVTGCHTTESPQWGGVANCSTCHEAGSINISGVHSKHWETIAGDATARITGNASQPGYYQFQCGTCHDPDLISHPTGGNGEFLADVQFNISWLGASYQKNAAYAPNVNANDTLDSKGLKISTDGQCSTVYCHSSGIAPGASAPTYAPVAWNAVSTGCNFCHGAPPATNAHAKHATTYSMGCTECHQATASSNTAIGDKTKHVNSVNDVAWQTSGNNSDGSAYETAGADTCSNIYCHSQGSVNAAPYTTGANVGNAPNSSVLWTGSMGTECTGCHSGDSAVTGGILVMSSGKHGKHIGNSSVIGKDITCDNCHSATVAADQNRTIGATPTNHVNKQVNVAFTTLNTGASYSGTVTPGDSFGSCSTSYCHSIGNTSAPAGQLPGGAPSIYTTPGWGDAAWITVCNGCHGRTTTSGAPDYTTGAAGSVSANSHSAHVGGAPDCANCHTDTTTTGTVIKAGSTLHINQAKNVNFAAAIDQNGGTNSDNYNTTSKTCSTISCHGAGTPQWGGPSQTCSNCHLGAGDLDDYTWSNFTGTAARIDSTEWSYSGHGKTAGTYEVTVNPAANLPGAAGTGDACLYCHDKTGVPHGDATNVFRLRNFTHATWGKNGACLVCHDTDGIGLDPDGAGTVYANKTATKKVDKYHYGSQHSASLNSGQFCWDCHDPHGDRTSGSGPIAMIHRNPAQASNVTTGAPTTSTATAVVFSARTAGSDYANSTTGNGVCQVCHTYKAADPNKMVHWYNTAPYTADGHNSGTVCTQCHKHSPDTTYNGEAFKGGGCNGCHDYDTNAGAWGKAPTPIAVEGWGAHAKHIDHIKARFPAVTLDPNADTFGTGAAAAVCGTCHTNTGANHSTSGGGTRSINFGDGTYKEGGAAGFDFRFGAINPLYNGVVGQSSSVNPKTCSNISCHFKATPVWSAY